jgi:hypothetical protein
MDDEEEVDGEFKMGGDEDLDMEPLEEIEDDDDNLDPDDRYH